jgi:hypothetical protein
MGDLILAFWAGAVAGVLCSYVLVRFAWRPK